MFERVDSVGGIGILLWGSMKIWIKLDFFGNIWVLGIESKF